MMLTTIAYMTKAPPMISINNDNLKVVVTGSETGISFFPGAELSGVGMVKLSSATGVSSSTGETSAGETICPLLTSIFSMSVETVVGSVAVSAGVGTGAGVSEVEERRPVGEVASTAACSVEVRFVLAFEPPPPPDDFDLVFEEETTVKVVVSSERALKLSSPL